MARLTSLVVLGAIGASAQPHGHAHLHKERHIQNRNIGDIITATIGGQVVSWTQTEDYGAAVTSAASAAAYTLSAAASISASVSVGVDVSATASASAATSTSTSGSSSSSAGKGVTEYTTFDDWCSQYDSYTEKRATTEEIAKEGNTGSTYGCNFMPLASEDLASEYANTAKFYGGDVDYTCYMWNKIAKDGSIAGWYMSEDSYTTFDVAAGEYQYYAFDNNTLGSATCFDSSKGYELDSNGGFMGTWFEFTFVDSDTGYSAADASCIQAEDGDGTIYGLEVCTEDEATCSTISSGATSVKAAFTSADKAADGYGININGAMKVTVNIGYTN